MKSLPLGIQASTTTSYDQTKTTLQGRARARTITDGNGAKTCLGVSPVVVGDVFDDTGVSPVAIHCSTTNGRIFIGKGIVASIWTISYYTFDTTLGTTSWVGDIKLTLPSGTQTLKGFEVDDTSSSNMTINFVTTSTTVQTGGFFGVYGVNVTDFVKVSVPTFATATVASTNKVVYQIGDAATQGTHTLTVGAGIGLDISGGFAYILAGVAATPKIFKFVNTVPTTAPVSGYSIANGTIVVTGTLAALSGTILLVNCVRYSSTIGHTTNSGSPVLAWITTTNLYCAKVSDVVNAAVTLPTLVTANMAPSADYLTPTASLGQYSSVLDKWVILTTLGKTLIKQCVNNDPNAILFGGNDTIKIETGGTVTPSDFGGVTNLCVTMMSGWAVLTNTAIGQRDFVALDLYSDQTSTTAGQINTSIISPVMSNVYGQTFYLAVYKEFTKRSVYPTIQYRTTGFATGPGAGFDALWTTAPKDGDLTPLTLLTGGQIQFRILFTVAGYDNTNTSQINELYLLYQPLNEISSNWEGSVDNTTQNGASPCRTAFRLNLAYASTVPTLYFRAYDDSNNLVISANTSANASSFEYSTNNGTSWLPLGTIPNTINTTEVRYNWTSPPGVRVTSSIRES